MPPTDWYVQNSLQVALTPPPSAGLGGTPELHAATPVASTAVRAAAAVFFTFPALWPSCHLLRTGSHRAEVPGTRTHIPRRRRTPRRRHLRRQATLRPGLVRTFYHREARHRWSVP